MAHLFFQKGKITALSDAPQSLPEIYPAGFYHAEEQGRDGRKQRDFQPLAFRKNSGNTFPKRDEKMIRVVVKKRIIRDMSSYVKRTRTTKHPNKTDVAESAFYQYNDSNGNLISETGEYGTDKVETCYDYTVGNRLEAVYDADRLLMAAAYDGDGNRVFRLNYNLHTDEDRKDNSGNGN